MNKKNTISREIAMVTLKVSAISLLVSAIAFLVIYIASESLGYSFTGAIGAGIISLMTLSLILPVKTGERIAKKINSVDVNNVYFGDEIYDELDELKKKISAQKKLNEENISKMSAFHKEQDDMRRDFTANVSHELKTPLTSIKGYSELLRDGLVKEEDVTRFAGKIYDESHRLITLVGDIIKLSQLDGNDVKVEIEEINLFELTEGVIGQLEMAAREKNVSLSLIGDKPIISGAGQIIEEMIFNIIDNAIKYNKQDGEVKVKIRQRIDGVELEVMDTGIGIAEKDVPHIFERFWRADKSHSKEIGGTGLGLSIVKHGAMFTGASISVKSEINVGTTIRILF